MSARAERADHLTKADICTDVQRADHRLVRGADAAMVDADHRLAGDGSDEGHCAACGCEDCLTRLGGKINTAMARSPVNRRGMEPSLYHEGTAQRPASRHRQSRRRRRRSCHGEHKEVDSGHE
jgi:hypothetical protein